MRVLLVSTYELGHQPLHVASPAAALHRAGHEVRCLDLSVERWDTRALEWSQAVGFSVPMHTAMRLAMRAAAGVRRARPELPVCFYGLYAPVSRDLTVGALADRVIAGEYEPALTAWVGALAAGGPPGRARGRRGPPPAQGRRSRSSSSAAASSSSRHVTCCRRSSATRTSRSGATSGSGGTSRGGTAACAGVATARCPPSTTGASGSSAQTPC